MGKEALVAVMDDDRRKMEIIPKQYAAEWKSIVFPCSDGLRIFLIGAAQGNFSDVTKFLHGMTSSFSLVACMVTMGIKLGGDVMSKSNLHGLSDVIYTLQLQPESRVLVVSLCLTQLSIIRSILIVKELLVSSVVNKLWYAIRRAVAALPTRNDCARKESIMMCNYSSTVEGLGGNEDRDSSISEYSVHGLGVELQAVVVVAKHPAAIGEDRPGASISEVELLVVELPGVEK
ncbi:hypothetical protein ACH5RR_039768 [Cinchona calisaya]|uniref:Uncharacterized protein n=1 Tax=Cinchona calisaya TaxID=153742 RepID=A0ABD2Y1T9_9GENT